MMEKAEQIFVVFCDYLAWLLMGILNPGHRLEEVKNRKIKSEQSIIEDSIRFDDYSKRLISAKALLESEEQRKLSIEEKFKNLLTLSGLMIAAVAASSTVLSSSILLLPIFLFLSSATFLILRHLDVGKFVGVDWRKIALSNMRSDEGEFLGLIHSADDLNIVNCFSIAVYRAALRSTMIALFIACLVFGFALVFHSDSGESPNDQTSVNAELNENEIGSSHEILKMPEFETPVHSENEVHLENISRRIEIQEESVDSAEQSLIPEKSPSSDSLLQEPNQ